MIPLPALTARDRRTLRLGGMGLGAYLLLFGGWSTWQYMEKHRTNYRQLVRTAGDIRTRIELYQSRVIRLHRLMDAAQMDPAQLSQPKLVGGASAAIQQAATQGGLQLGPIRETAAKGSENELGTLQLEAFGQVRSITTFLHRLGSLGFPIIVDSVQISSDPMRPGFIKLSLVLILLNYEQWNMREENHV